MYKIDYLHLISGDYDGIFFFEGKLEILKFKLQLWHPSSTVNKITQVCVGKKCFKNRKKNAIMKIQRKILKKISSKFSLIFLEIHSKC